MIFIIEPSFIESVKKVIAFAEANPLYMDDILDMMNGSRPVAGNTEGHFIIDPFGTKIVYTIDVLPEHTLRHISISMNNGHTLPNPVMVAAIIDVFGFKSKLGDCIIEVENRNPYIGILNVAEIIN